MITPYYTINSYQIDRNQISSSHPIHANQPAVRHARGLVLQQGDPGAHLSTLRTHGNHVVSDVVEHLGAGPGPLDTSSTSRIV